MDDRALLYSTCLRHGGVFDLYRWVHLDRLLETWPLLDLPIEVAAPWLSAFRLAKIPPSDLTTWVPALPKPLNRTSHRRGTWAGHPRTEPDSPR